MSSSGSYRGGGGVFGLFAGEGFSSEEALIAESILSIKMIYGIGNRAKFSLINSFDSKDIAGKVLASNPELVLNQAMKNVENLTKDYATRLGLSKERFEQIHDYVYENETKW